MRQHLREAADRFPRLATDVPYVRLQAAPRTILTDDEIKSLGLIPVYRREDAVLAAYATDRELQRLESQLESYSHLRKKLNAIAKIDSIKPWSRDDRTSARLKAIRIDPRREYTVDLFLLPVEERRADRNAVAAIERFVSESQGRVIDRAIEPTFTAMRVRLGGQSLNSLLDYRDDVALVDVPPRASVLVPEVMSLDLTAIPDTAPPGPTAPAVCVVDSGILEGHPLLENAILSDRSRSFPATLGPPVPQPPVDRAGHVAMSRQGRWKPRLPPRQRGNPKQPRRHQLPLRAGGKVRSWPATSPNAHSNGARCQA